MQRKSILLSLPLLVLLAGCQAVLPPPPIPPYQGVTLKVACPPALSDLIHSQSSAWRSRQQAAVEVLPSGESEQADVLVIRANELAGLAAAGKLAAVPTALQERSNPFEWGALLPFYREQLLQWDRKNVAFALLGESPVCLYRADLFANPAHQEGFRRFAQEHRKQHGGPLRDLRPPASWEDFALIAEYFRHNHPLGKDTPSLPPLSTDDRDLDRLFYTVAASYARRAVKVEEQPGPDHIDEVFSFHYDQGTGEPRIATPGFVAALALLSRLQRCRPGAARAYPEEAFAAGRAVLCIADAPALLAARKGLTSPDKIGICMIPGSDRYFQGQTGRELVLREGVNRVPYLGGAGWLAVVPTKSPRTDAAFDLLADLCSPARSTQIVLEPRWAGPTRTDHVLREGWNSFDLNTGQTAALKEAVSWTLMQHGLKNPLLCLRIPNAPRQQRDLAEAVRALLVKGGDPAETLRAVSGKWLAENAKAGKEAHLSAYRLSLGLLGK
jgi:hypothetical protein